MAEYVSTSCLKNKGDLFQTLDAYAKLGIENVELGVYTKQLTELNRLEDYDFNYAVHHYFPPPKENFVLNLASSDKEILSKSRKQMKSSIDFCTKYGIKLLSFHSGFRSDPDESFRLNRKKVTGYEESFNIFKESLDLLVDYAGSSDLLLAIENNVLTKENTVDGRNELLLMCETWEFTRLFDEMKPKNLGLLVDTGHLKVTSKTLGFGMKEFVEKTSKKIFAFHVHENNGLKDEHLGIKEGDGVLSLIKGFSSKPIILESFCRDEEEILANLNVLKKL